ncbi:SDR family NAD(P)-dependent oxidoreductase [Bacillus sp. UNC438CL73TsuS30]|uniref:SDR family NAD(P)-dependent oxidoreductase n=1 Tax=Bacillus sp. UNC438CL73TsuS30 TaxID=1340434 RepID=UPI00068D562C|nr:glucose 1-dehydrogenase [Bacillus sp. UNC438CL73TsuS30]
MKLKNKVALITGSGSGIGKTTALLLSQEGAHIIVTDINEKNGNQTVEEIHHQGGKAIFLQHDVSQEEHWARVVEESMKTFKSIDILFNNAGLFLLKPLLETSMEEWNKLMSVNVTGTFLGMKYVIPCMLKNKRGSVINASSTAALIGAAGHTLYGASKGAIRTMSKDAAMEFGPYVRVNSIYPGFIKTQMVEYASRMANKQPEEQARTIPLRRLGAPLDVAKMVLYLSSEESAYITGAEFVIDGGLSAGKPVWAEEPEFS